MPFSRVGTSASARDASRVRLGYPVNAELVQFTPPPRPPTRGQLPTVCVCRESPSDIGSPTRTSCYLTAWTTVPLCSVVALPLLEAMKAGRSGQLSIASFQ